MAPHERGELRPVGDGSWKHKYNMTRPGVGIGFRHLWRSAGRVHPGDQSRPERDSTGRGGKPGEVLANLVAPNAAKISYLRFSPDGSRLIALENQQQVQVWDLRPPARGVAQT